MIKYKLKKIKLSTHNIGGQDGQTSCINQITHLHSNLQIKIGIIIIVYDTVHLPV